MIWRKKRKSSEIKTEHEELIDDIRLVLTAEGTNPSQREKAPSVFVKLQNKKNLDQDLSSIWNGT